MVSSKTRDMRGRPRGFEEEEALEKAMLAFWRHGYGNTSLDDLVRVTGASRASIYRVFGDKRAVFEKALMLYGARFSDRVDAALASPETGRERLTAVLNASASRLTSSEAPPGCLRCNSTLELMGTDANLDAVLRDANALFLCNIERLIKRSVDDGEVPKGLLKPLAMYFTGVVNGMVTLARGGATRQELDQLIVTSLEVWPRRN